MTFLNRPRALLFHEPADAILAALDPLALQHLLNAPAAVSMAAFQENERDLLGEQGILLAPIFGSYGGDRTGRCG